MSGRQEAAPAPPSSATAASLADGDDAAAVDTTRTSGAAAVVLPPAVPVSVLQQQQQQFGSNRSANSWTNPQQQPPIKRTKSTVYGMDESFTLHPVSLQVPVHIWEHMGGHFSLPHHHFGLPKGEGVEGALRVGRRLRRLVHVPGLPIRRNWPFMKQHWLADLCAGLTCAVMLIPQGMAYMMLASLPPIIGLHTATIAPFFFVAFGTTRNVLSVGPVALASIYLPTALSELGLNPQSLEPADQLNRAAVGSALTLWIGIIFLIMSAFRLGSLIRFLSFSVMCGFTTAAGLYVGLSQLKYILNLHPPQTHYHVSQFAWLATHLHEANPRTTALGLTALALLLLVKFLKRRYPPTPAREARLGYRAWRAVATFATLLVVAASALAAWLMDRHGQGIPTVGAIEPGLSRAAFPSWSRLELQTTAVATQAVPLALLAFMETYSVGRKFAEENRVELDQNQDLFALGVGNLVSSCFSTFVAAGSFGRTALAQEVGARSTMSNLWMALFIILTLSCLTGLLETIPLAVLGAVIEAAVMSLIDFPEMRRALRVAPLSGCVMIITFFATFLLTIETGLLYGVAASLAILLYQLSSVTLTELGLEEEEGLRFVSLEEHPAAKHVARGIAVVRPVGSIFFGNAASFRARIHRLLTTGSGRERALGEEDDEHGDGATEDKVQAQEDEEAGGGAAVVDRSSRHGGQGGEGVIQHVLIDACAMRVLDLTALGGLADVIEEAGDRGVAVVMTNLNHALKRSLESCGLLERLGGPLVVMSTEEVYARLVALRSMDGSMDDADQDKDNRHGDDGKDAGSTMGHGGGLGVSPGRERSDSTGSETFHRRIARTWSSREARALLLRGEEPGAVGAAETGAPSPSVSPLRSSTTAARGGGGVGGNGGL